MKDTVMEIKKLSHNIDVNDHPLGNKKRWLSGSCLRGSI